MRIVYLCLLLLLVTLISGLKNLIGTDLQKCLNCLCHARTGCYSRIRCASYSIGYNYWKKANSPVIDSNDDPDKQSSYRKCMNNENCILNTIEQFASAVGHLDCNCDGVFDCKDRVAIHLFGENCGNHEFNKHTVDRFNWCVKNVYPMSISPMEASEGSECDASVMPH